MGTHRFLHPEYYTHKELPGLYIVVFTYIKLVLKICFSSLLFQEKSTKNFSDEPKPLGFQACFFTLSLSRY